MLAARSRTRKEKAPSGRSMRLVLDAMLGREAQGAHGSAVLIHGVEPVAIVPEFGAVVSQCFARHNNGFGSSLLEAIELGSDLINEVRAVLNMEEIARHARAPAVYEREHGVSQPPTLRVTAG